VVAADLRRVVDCRRSVKVTYEQLVPDFMQAVHRIGQHTGGRAHVGEIMPRLGLNVSSAVDISMPTTEDDRLYMNLARYCEEMHYIEKEADRYVWVRITDTGKQYVESGSRRL
jgi:hypothetical protein